MALMKYAMIIYMYMFAKQRVKSKISTERE